PLLVLRVVLLAAPLDPAVEPGRVQQGVELLVERMPGRVGEPIRGDEERFLPRLALAHRHCRSPPARPGIDATAPPYHAGREEYFNGLLARQTLRARRRSAGV